MKFSNKDFFSKCDQIRSFLWIWSHLLKKSLMENFIFCAVRYATEQNTHLAKTNISALTNSLLEYTKLISYFNSIVDTSGVDNFDDDAHEKLLHDMLSLFLRVRSYSLTPDIFSKLKLSFKKIRSKSLRKEIRKSTKMTQK